MESSCACTVAAADKNELLPGEQTTLHARVSRPSIGYQQASVAIFSNSTTGDRTTLDLKCWAASNQARIVNFRPHRIRLSNIDGGDGAPEIEIATLERVGTPLIRSANSDLPWLGVVETRVEEVSRMPPEFVHRKYRFLVAMTDEHPYGRFEGLVRFQMTLEEGDTRPAEFTLPIDVVAMPPVYADPEVLFATITKGSPLPTWSVKLRCRMGYTLAKSLSATCTADWLTVEMQEPAPVDNAVDEAATASARTLAVRVVAAPPASPGRATVTIKTDDPDVPAIEIPVVIAREPPVVASDAGT